MYTISRVGLTEAEQQEEVLKVKTFQDRWRRSQRVSHFLDEPCELGKEHYGECMRFGEHVPYYGYKASDGTYIEKTFSMEDDIPAEIEEDNKLYKRIWGFRGFHIR